LRTGHVVRALLCSPDVPNRFLRPSINEATIRLLTRHGVEVVPSKGEG
jgi:hypothetical protein